MSNEYGFRVGLVTLSSIDLGLVKALGATVESGKFVLPMVGKDFTITFENPEPSLRSSIMPYASIIRDDPNFSVTRPCGVNSMEYFVHAPDANAIIDQNGNPGFDKYVRKKAARQCDINYTIQIYDRSRHLINDAYQFLLGKIVGVGYITVTDSLQVTRDYSYFFEGSSKLDDVVSVTERVIGVGLSVRVETEIDVHEEEILTNIVTKPIIRGRLT